jgi:hypothetical protein
MKIVPPNGGSPEVGMTEDVGEAVAGGAVGGEGAADVGGTLRGGDGGDAGETADPPPPHAALVNAATKAKVTILIMVGSYHCPNRQPRIHNVQNPLHDRR